MEYTYSHLPPSKPAPRRRKLERVFGIGSRAFVNWVPPAGQALVPVPMVDGNGQPIANDLRDGQEVEILSWRPGAREGVVYQVLRKMDRTEWSIAVEYLRREPQAPAAVDGVDSPKD